MAECLLSGDDILLGVLEVTAPLLISIGETTRLLRAVALPRNSLVRLAVLREEC